MPFYRKEDDQLLSGPTVYGPGFTLLEENKDEHQYPVEGWYWYENLDKAIAGFAAKSTQLVCGPYQLRKALMLFGLYDTVVGAMEFADDDTKLAWNHCAEFYRDNPMIESMRLALGRTKEEVDALFELAITL
jgi:hypothetical protein